MLIARYWSIPLLCIIALAAEVIGQEFSAPINRPAVELPTIGRANGFAEFLNRRSPIVNSLRATQRDWNELTGRDRVEQMRALHRLSARGGAGVPTLVKAVQQSDDAMFQFRVGLELTKLGSPAAPHVAQALLQCEEDNRFTFARILMDMGPRAKGAVPLLTRAVGDAHLSQELRTHVVGILGSIGPDAAAATDTLISIVRSEDDDTFCAEAVTALGAIAVNNQEAVDAVAFVLNSNQRSLEVYHSAIEATCRIAPRKEAVRLLTNFVGKASTYTEVKAKALRSLAEFGADATQAVPHFLQALKSKDEGLVFEAVIGLGAIAGENQTVVIMLSRMLDRDDIHHELRTEACRSLLQLGPAGVTETLDRLDHSEFLYQIAAASALTSTPPEAAEQVTTRLNELLRKEPEPELRFEAIKALAKLPTNDEAMRLLQAIASNESAAELRHNRAAAITALGVQRDSSESTIDLLVEVARADTEDPYLRAAAVTALARSSAKNVPTLVELLNVNEPRVRVAAANAIGMVRLRNRHALPALVQAIKDPATRPLAMMSIESYGIEAADALVELAHDESAAPDARTAAVFALGQVGSGTTPLLIDMVADDVLQFEATEALRNRGASAIAPILDKMAILESQIADKGDKDGSQGALVIELRSIVEDLTGELGGPAMAAYARSESGFMELDELAMYERPVAMAAESAAPSHEPLHAPMDTDDRSDPPASPEAEEAEAADHTVVNVFYGTNRTRAENEGNRSKSLFWNLLPTIVAAALTVWLSFVWLARSKVWLRVTAAMGGLAVTGILALFATDQLLAQARNQARPGPKYGSEDARRLELGICEVTIPKDHSYGEVEAPSVFHFEYTEDPRKHVILKRAERLESEQFFQQMRDEMNTKGDSLLVFVHGYNVTFEAAARRTAQMVYDLEFNGAAAFYSWPSRGDWHQYRADEKQVSLAADHLRDFLLQLALRSQTKSIHLIAHSMGNRALTTALGEIRQDLASSGPLFNEVILAAPDIDADIFRDQIVPAIQGKAERFTLYASTNDLALVASRFFNGGDPRAGDVKGGCLAIPGIDTIDVSAIDTSLLGHSYYGSNRSVLQDIKRLLVERRPPELRPFLRAALRRGRKYWVFASERIAERVHVDDPVR